MKRILKWSACLCLVLCLLSGCSNETEPPSESEVESIPYDGEQLSRYLAPVTYRERTVILANEDASKSEAVWQAILADTQVLEYPSEQVAYYLSQLRAEYRYLAHRENMSYEELLALRDMTEESVEAEAKQMVKSDLVYLYILADAELTLTETEKETLYDRYADRYVEKYGYDRAYVEEHMKELVFDSMLYDKTMEYLILQNNFVVGE